MNRATLFAPALLLALAATFVVGCYDRATVVSPPARSDLSLVAWIDVEGDAAHRADAERALRAEARKIGGDDVVDVEFHAAKQGPSHYTATAIKLPRENVKR